MKACVNFYTIQTLKSVTIVTDIILNSYLYVLLYLIIELVLENYIRASIVIDKKFH